MYMYIFSYIPEDPSPNSPLSDYSPTPSSLFVCRYALNY